MNVYKSVSVLSEKIDKIKFKRNTILHTMLKTLHECVTERKVRIGMCICGKRRVSVLHTNT